MITEEDIQQDFRLMYDCGNGLPQMPLMTKFRSDISIDNSIPSQNIFNLMELFSQNLRNDNFIFVWYPKLGYAVPYVKQNVSLTKKQFRTRFKTFLLNYDLIKRFLKYQITNSRITDTLISMGLNRVNILLLGRDKNNSTPPMFHTDATFFTIIATRNIEKPYAFGTEFFMDLKKLQHEKDHKISNAGKLLEGNYLHTLNELVEYSGLKTDTKATLFRNILDNNDTVCFANLLWTHSIPTNRTYTIDEDGNDTQQLDIQIKLDADEGVFSAPVVETSVLLCSHRITMDKVDENMREVIVCTIEPDDLGDSFTKLFDYYFSLEDEDEEDEYDVGDEDDNKMRDYLDEVSDLNILLKSRSLVPIDIPEIVLNAETAQHFFSILNQIEPEECMQFKDVIFKNRGGKQKRKMCKRRIRRTKRKISKTRRRKKKRHIHSMMLL
jgi:hypothetical protein